MSSRSLPDTLADAIASPARLAIHLDLVGGLAGDMFVAALVDALPELAAPVLAELAAAAPPGASLPGFAEARSGGLRAQRLRAVARSPQTDHHAHHGTSYADLRRTLETSAISLPTRRHSLALLALLAEAEAQVHGLSVEQVHFHELADWDSLLDLVAAGCIAARLEGAQWSVSSLPLGGGTVEGAHGRLPVPAPATSALLVGYPWHDDGVQGERVTPTGAAILRHLVPPSAAGRPPSRGRLGAVGCGAGMRELPGMANIVRALVFEHAATDSGTRVAIVEFDVDDMTGEEIALAAERLRTRQGVLDVSIGSRMGKKGRPLTDFRVVATPNAVDAVAEACFRETSTLGLRVGEERRHLLPRRETPTLVDGQSARVKIAERPEGERTAKAAHDDVAHSPSLAERRRVRAASEQRALEGDGK